MMVDPRATVEECRNFLTQLSLNFYEVVKAAVNGHYGGYYFTRNTDPIFSPQSSATIRRLRAVIQYMNAQFSISMHRRGHKYHVDRPERSDFENEETIGTDMAPIIANPELGEPTTLSEAKALEWVGQVLMRTRGRELPGNFNPLLVGELFWEQSSKWQKLAHDHVEGIAQVCSRFLNALLREKCPRDVYTRLWSSKIEDALKLRSENSAKVMGRMMEDIRSYPITYNRYYTDTISKRRRVQGQKSLSDCIENATRVFVIFVSSLEFN